MLVYWRVYPKNPGFPRSNPMTWECFCLTINPTRSGGYTFCLTINLRDSYVDMHVYVININIYTYVYDVYCICSI